MVRKHNDKHTPVQALKPALLALAIAQALAMQAATAASIEVTSSMDISANDTDCTLREAIATVNTGSAGTSGCVASGTDALGTNDTITFDSALAGNTITLNGSPLSITNNVSINPYEYNNTLRGLTIDANSASRVMDIDGAVVALNYLTLSGGSITGNGGGIYARNSSSVTLSGSTVSGNSAGAGGGIFAEGSPVALSDSTVSGNSAAGPGGGIFTRNSSLTLSDSEVSGNSGYAGGGVYANGSSVTLSNSTVSGNTAYRGGGIDARGSSIVTLSDSTVSGNSAFYSFGGGIFAENTSSVTLSNSTVSGNSAGRNGGGIFAENTSSVTLSNSTVSGNTATFGGGISAINSSSVTLSNSTVSGNTAAGYYGGGIFANRSSSVTLSNSTVSGNSAGYYGGGISAREASSVTLSNSTVSGNSALLGGGIYARGSSIVTLSNSTVSGNNATNRGGGIYANGSSITLSNSIVANSSGDDCLNNSNSTITAGLDSISSDGSCTGATMTDPKLGPLADNGGPTLTHALLADSPAIRTVDNGGGMIDQRGFVAVDERDIGAYEFEAISHSPSIDIRKQADGPDTRGFSPGDPIDFEIEVTNTGDVDLTNVQVTDPLLPICDNTIGALSAGESVTYTCTTTAPTNQELANTTVVVFEDNFDTDTGWVIDPNGTDTATEGMFEVANPEYTSAGSYDFQLSANPNGSDGNTLVTGALLNGDYRANDVDNGVTSARSPAIQLPDKGITIVDLSYYFSHSWNYTDPEKDYFKIKLLDANSTDELVLLDERMVLSKWRYNRDWDALSEDISLFNGRTVYLYIEASDSEFSSIRTNVIEAGVDEIKITNDPRDHIVFEDDFETNIGWVINPDGTDTATSGLFEVGVLERVRSRYGPGGYINLTPYPSIGYENSLLTGVTANDNNLYDSGFNDVDGGVTTARSPLIQIPDDGISNIDFEYFYGSDGLYRRAHHSGDLDTTDPTDYFRVSVIDPATNETQVIFQRGSKNPDNRTMKGDAFWYELDLASKFVDFPETAVDPLFVAPNGDISSFNGREVYIQVEASDGVDENSIEVGIDNIRMTNVPLHRGFVTVANVTGDYDDQVVTDTDSSKVIILAEDCVVPVGPYDGGIIKTQHYIYPPNRVDSYDLEVSFNADNTLSLRGRTSKRINSAGFMVHYEIDLLFSEHSLAGTPYPAGTLQNGTAPDGEYYKKVTGTMISFSNDNAYPSYIYSVSNREENALIGTGASYRHPNVYGLGAWLYARNLTTQNIQGGTHSSLYFAISVDRENCINVSANPQTNTVFEDDFETDTGWVINPDGTDTATEGMFEVAKPELVKPGSYTYQISDNPDGSDGNTLVTGALAGSHWQANDVENGVTSARSPAFQLPEMGETLLDLSYYFSHGHGIPDPQRDYFKLKLVDDIGNELILIDERMHRYVWRRQSKWDTLSENISWFNGRTVYLHAEASDSETSRASYNLIEAGLDDIKISNRY